MDIKWENHGSIYLARLLSPAAKAWAAEHTPQATRWGQALVVEHRYAAEIAAQMCLDGLDIN